MKSAIYVMYNNVTKAIVYTNKKFLKQWIQRGFLLNSVLSVSAQCHFPRLLRKVGALV